MESKLTTLYDLLTQGYTVAQLATTIETHGIHGWDCFGRYGEYKAKSTGAEQALTALANFYEEEERFWQRVEAKPPQNDEDMALIVSEAPLEVVSEFKTLALHRFGWPADSLPPINRNETFPQVPRYARDTPKSLNLLRTIGALLDVIENRERKYRKTELIKILSERNPEVPGLAKSTLEKWFPAAESAFKEAKNK